MRTEGTEKALPFPSGVTAFGRAQHFARAEHWRRRHRVALLALFALVAVCSAFEAPAAGPYSVDQRLAQFGDAARARLAPYYAAAGLQFPGQRVALLAFKDRRVLELQVQDQEGDWHWLREYPVLAASGGPGPKLRQGDGQVPEGRYRVVFLNANSLYHVSLRLDYPNAFDREMARLDGRSALGGDIMIHGRQVSIGCLAMGDAVAEELFTLAARVGPSRVDVLIAPTDFRRGGYPAATTGPGWTGRLYAGLRDALQRYPNGPDRSAICADFPGCAALIRATLLRR